MLGHLRDAFLITTVPLATESERRRNTNPRKVYPVDPGLIQTFDTSGRSNLGHALETVVLNELERRKAEVAYVKTTEGLEVDFYVRYPAGGQELVQVCADPSPPIVQDRELRALAQASREYPRATGRLLVSTRDQVPVTAPPGVDMRPAYEWLLADPGAA
jgi:predicted AAA+ superfamily ATPase